MQRACSRLRQRNPNLFIVDSLFANNEQGAWYDPSDLNTLFQDDAGTVPVTASGQTVGRILDKSGRGNHAAQAAAASRPTFRDVDGLRYLEFDGVDDFLMTAAANFTATDEVTVFAGVRKLSDAATGIVVELSAGLGGSNNAFNIMAPRGNPGGTGNYGFQSRGTATANAQTAGTFAAPHSSVLTGIGDISGDVATLRVNSVISASDVADQGAGNYGNHQIFIGRRGGVSLPFVGHIYGIIIRGVTSDASSITNAERYLAAKTGVTLT